MALKGRRFKDVAMIQAKSWDAPAEFQIVDFRKCFEWWRLLYKVPRRLRLEDSVGWKVMISRNNFSPETDWSHLV
jgi:hypothetical protein